MANQFALTPLVRKVKGGTFITLQSTGEDLTFTFNNSNKKFVYSKFALLDIPPIQDSVNNENTIQHANIEGHFTQGLSTASPAPEGDRVDMSESLQNYLLNMETLLIKGTNYDQTLLQNAGERMFFKWLKELGAVRFRESDSIEHSSVIDGTTLDLTRFTEEDDNDNIASDIYKRVVKYIGEIDIDGAHLSNTNGFKEVYCYVPTGNGHTPTILFKSHEDENYFAGMTIRKEDLVDIEFIAGRDASDDPTTAGLGVSAFYDMDVPFSSYTYTVNGGLDSIWFAPLAANGPNAYFTDPVFGDVTNDEINRTNPSDLSTIDYKRSRLDGIMIDWEQSNYKYFEDNPDIVTFGQYNSTDQANSFKFNTVLLYYDVFDPNDETTRKTNLYGVLFVEDLEVISAGAAKLKSLDKIKPNKVIGEQGNGYGIKLNFKFDVTADNVASDVEISVNSYNTFSMEIFSDTMQRMAQILGNTQTVIDQNLSLQARLDDLEQLIINDANKESLQAQIDDINEILAGVTPTTDLEGLIQANTDSINDILSGSTTVDLNFSLSLQAFDGLRLELVNNVLSFKNKRQAYPTFYETNINVSASQASAIINVLDLGTHDTLAYHKNGGLSKDAQANIDIYINDGVNNWKNGQSMKIVFLDEIDFSGYGFTFYTDANNDFNLSLPYNKLIGVIPSVDRMKPEIEIVCIDEDNYEFVVWQK